MHYQRTLRNERAWNFGEKLLTWESLLVGLNCADLYVAKVICFGNFLRLMLPRWGFNYVTGHTVFWIWWVTRAYGSFVYSWFIASLSPRLRHVVAQSNTRHYPTLWLLAGWNSFRGTLLKLPLQLFLSRVAWGKGCVVREKSL